MTQHHATVSWAAGAAGFERRRFSRTHRWRFDGGLELVASASPSIVPPPWSDPAAVDPEEAFVAAIASCHMMSFLHLAAEAGFAVSSYRDEARGELSRRADGESWISAVTLRPQATYDAGRAPSGAVEAELHRRAHALCFIANSVRSSINIEPLSPRTPQPGVAAKSGSTG